MARGRKSRSRLRHSTHCDGTPPAAEFEHLRSSAPGGADHAGRATLGAALGGRKADRQTPKRLCAFLTVFPDFTLKYLMTLRRAFVKHQREQPAFQRAVIAIRMRRPIVNSYGKPARFEDATDLEICAALNVSPATYKKAKQHLARMEAPPKCPPSK